MTSFMQLYQEKKIVWNTNGKLSKCLALISRINFGRHVSELTLGNSMNAMKILKTTNNLLLV